MNSPTYPSELAIKFFDTTEPLNSADCLMVLCHGYGAPGTDLVPIAREILQNLSDSGSTHQVRIVVPQAPLSLEEFEGYDARAWWQLNMQKLQDAIGSGDLTELCQSVPPGLDQANRLLTDLVRSQCEQFQIPLSKVILAGFSQGAMLSTDVALNLPEPVGGLAILSGTLVCQTQWQELAKTKPGMQVFQTHGSLDPILPIAGAEMLARLLSDAGLEVQFGVFQGPHTIPTPAVTELTKMVSAVAAT